MSVALTSTYVSVLGPRIAYSYRIMATIGATGPADRTPEIVADEKGPADNVDEVNNDPKYDSDGSSDHKQEGVKKVEAVTSVWTKKTLVIMFVL